MVLSNTRRNKWLCGIALISALLVGMRGARAHDAGPQAPSDADFARAGEEMARAAGNFWAALTPEQQKTAGYEVKDEERQDWHFIPKPRKGLAIKDMAPAQRDLAQALLASGLSQRGYAQAVTIMSLDAILKDIEQGKGPVRDPDNYYFTIFGTPGAAGAWGWRVEGHHLSLNFTIVDGKGIASTPAFLGTNPASVLEGPRRGLTVLDREENMGRELVKSFTDEQKKIVIFEQTSPKEVVSGNKRKIELEKPVGVSLADMSPDQRKLLTDLVKVYATRLRPELADKDLDKIQKAGWDKIYFGWAGAVEPGQGHYYRIQGPTFLIEFDNTQNNANHVHTVWRDPASDFGEDLLAEHYKQHPHDAPTPDAAQPKP